MSLNPYAAPQPVVAEASLTRDASLTPFLAWERLRVWFNTILVLVVVVSALPQRELWFSYRLNYYCIEGAILANICFCVGLVAESYLRVVGWWRDPLRWVLFGLGTLLAGLLAHAGIVGPLSRL